MTDIIFLFFLLINSSISYNITKILDSMKTPGTTFLDLSYHKLKLEDSIPVAKSLPGTEITTLELTDNNLGNDGIIIFLNWLDNSNIHYMDLEGNNISVEGATALADILDQTKIGSLSLRNNKIGDQGIRSIAQILKNTSITELNLEQNDIGDDGAISLAPGLARINSIFLGDNKIGDKGVEKIANSLRKSVVVRLDLRNNTLGSRGVQSIAKNLRDTGVMYLDLRSNNLSFETARKFHSILNETQIVELRIWEENLDPVINNLCQLNQERIDEFLKQFEKFVIDVDGRLEFFFNYAWRTEYVEFSRIVRENKHFQYVALNYTKSQIDDFVWNIETRLGECFNKTVSISTADKFICVDFVLLLLILLNVIINSQSSNWRT